MARKLLTITFVLVLIFNAVNETVVSDWNTHFTQENDGKKPLYQYLTC